MILSDHGGSRSGSDFRLQHNHLKAVFMHSVRTISYIQTLMGCRPSNFEFFAEEKFCGEFEATQICPMHYYSLHM